MPGNEEAPTPHAGNLLRWLLLGGIGAGLREWAARKASLWCFSIHHVLLADLAGLIFSKLELRAAAVMKLSQFVLIMEVIQTATKKSAFALVRPLECQIKAHTLRLVQIFETIYWNCINICSFLFFHSFFQRGGGGSSLAPVIIWLPVPEVPTSEGFLVS